MGVVCHTNRGNSVFCLQKRRLECRVSYPLGPLSQITADKRFVKALDASTLLPLSVFACPVPEGKSGQQVVDGLQKQVEMMGATKSGNFLVDCETYQSNPQNVTQTPQQCVVNILHNSEHPASCFSVTESGQILVSDLLFEDLMSKLTMAKAGRESFYSQRKGFKIESRGQRYEVGDFIIKIGSVSLASNFRGILIEVEYCPCVILNECWNMMKELLQSMVGNSAETPPPVLKHKPDTVYTPSDTILQYLDHFNNFRKAVSAPPPSR